MATHPWPCKEKFVRIIEKIKIRGNFIFKGDFIRQISVMYPDIEANEKRLKANDRLMFLCTYSFVLFYRINNFISY
jgi:hypothetical protein